MKLISKLIMLLLIVGCEDDNFDELENFNGYMEIDSDGNIISEDSDDWCWDNEVLEEINGDYFTFCATEIETSPNDSDGIIVTQVMPIEYSLFPAYPNPFDSLVAIHYALPTDSNVDIKIIDETGNTVQMLVNTHQSPAFYCISWDGKDENGDFVETGLYRITFHAESYYCRGDIMYTP